MPQYVKIFENVLSPEQCAALIERFNTDARVQAGPQPEYSTRTYLNLSVTFDWMRDVQRMTQTSDPLVAEFFRLPEPFRHAEQKEWLNDGWVLARYRPGDICAFHDDAQSPVPPANGLRLATLIFFLNTVEDGGEPHFPVQNLKIQPIQGRVVIFPAQVTHPHEVLPPQQDRYVLQTWITDPFLQVVARED